MKSLEKLSLVDRAYTISGLMPACINGLIAFVEQLCKSVIDHPDDLEANWTPNPIVAPRDWLHMARTTLLSIEKYRSMFARKPRLFANELFGGYYGLFMSHCMEQYSKQPECPPRFRMALHLYFSEDQSPVTV